MKSLQATKKKEADEKKKKKNGRQDQKKQYSKNKTTKQQQTKKKQSEEKSKNGGLFSRLKSGLSLSNIQEESTEGTPREATSQSAPGTPMNAAWRKHPSGFNDNEVFQTQPTPSPTNCGKQSPPRPSSRSKLKTPVPPENTTKQPSSPAVSRPRRPVTRTFEDDEELVTRTQLRPTSGFTLEATALLPGTVTSKPPVQRTPSGIYQKKSSLQRQSSKKSEREMHGPVYNYTGSASQRPLSALSTATLDLSMEDAFASSTPSRPRSRLSGGSSVVARVKRFHSEPQMEISQLGSESAEGAPTEPRRSQCKYLYNLCNCHTISKKSTLNKLLTQKKNVSRCNVK